MQTMRYLLGHSIRNIPQRFKSKKHSFVTLLFVIVYLAVIPVLFNQVNLSFLKGQDNFTYLLSLGALVETPYIMYMFLVRKGITFKSADIHFLFQAPIPPKQIIIYGKNRNIIMNILTQFYLALIAFTVFKVKIGSCLIYIILSLAFGIVRDTSFAILLYGQDRSKGTSAQKAVMAFIWIILGLLVVSLIRVMLTSEFGFSLIPAYFDSPLTMAIPVVGWEIALIHLCIMGPTSYTMILTLINVAFIVLLTLLAVKAECIGDFYGDAMEYTELYEAAIQKRKMGGIYKVGQKEHVRTAHVTYKKPYAGALFYKNLLQYKKKPMFIFSGTTVILMVLAVILALSKFRGDALFTFPVYMVLILILSCILFQGFGIQWKKDILSPYFTLIPDKPAKKIFNVVIWEYLKAFIEGAIFGLIIAAGVGIIYLPYVIPTALIYCAVRNSRMHFAMIWNKKGSSIFGKFGQTILEYSCVIVVVIPILSVLITFMLLGMHLMGFVIAAAVAWGILGILYACSIKIYR